MVLATQLAHSPKHDRYSENHCQCACRFGDPIRRCRRARAAAGHVAEVRAPEVEASSLVGQAIVIGQRAVGRFVLPPTT